MRRYKVFLAVLLGASMLLAMMLGTGAAHATTGPTYLPLPKYSVPKSVEKLYKGEYKLQNANKALRLRSAAFSIIITDRGVLYGVGQFYGYDAQGLQDSWIAILYQFHTGPNGLMTMDLVGPGGFPVLGRMYVHRDKHGNLSGQMQLTGISGKHGVSWQKTTF